MNHSRPKHTPLEKLSSHVRSRLMLSAMLSILGVASIFGLLVIGGSYFMLRNNEQQRLYQGLEELISAVEGTAKVAAFADDATLAKEVATGLFSNPAVARVVITANTKTLVDLDRPNAHLNAQASQPLSREIKSPFNSKEIIGVLKLYPADEHVRQAATDSAQLLALLLSLELLGVACAVSWVVFAKVTRPIGSVAHDLHALKFTAGDMIWPPRGNEKDEIGQLVGDVNMMVARMQSLLLSERDLRDAIENSEEKFRLIFENAEAGIFTLDKTGRLHSWNPAMARLLGAEHFSAESNPALAQILACPQEKLIALIEQSSQNAESVWADFARGDIENNSEHFHIVLNPAGIGMLQGVCNDITERKRNEIRIRNLAERDALTGLLNRRGFEFRANDILSHAGPASGLTLIAIDLDGFKAVNDTLGHEAGDHVLSEVAKILEQSVRKSDLIARMGGDEFVILLINQASAETARGVARKILEALKTPILVSPDSPTHVGASIGLALWQPPSEALDTLLRRADQAMYAVKHASKNGFLLAASSDTI